jgi:hypothetical protein
MSLKFACWGGGIDECPCTPAAFITWPDGTKKDVYILSAREWNRFVSSPSGTFSSIQHQVSRHRLKTTLAQLEKDHRDDVHVMLL